MDDERSKREGRGGRWAGTVLLSLGSVGICTLAWYVHRRGMTRLDGAHLLYLPVVFACLWFGWRGLVVPVLGGACLVVPHFMGMEPGNPLEHDVLRTVVLIAVGGVISVLRRRHMASRREVRKLRWQLDKHRETSEAEYEILNCRLNRQLRESRDLGEIGRKGNGEKERILDSLVEHVIYQDREMRILWANRAACEFMGVARDAVVGRHCYELWAQKDKPCPECPLVEALETGRAAQGEKTTSDGRRWFVQGRPITDDRGEVVAGVEVTLDITECRTAQEQLQRIFDLSLDMVCIADIDTCTFTKVNPAFEGTLGYTEEELLGRPFLDFIHPEDIDRTVATVQDRLACGDRVINFENRYRGKDGTYRWLSWTSRPSPEEGLTYAVARDITEAKKAEEALGQERDLLRTLIDNLPDSVYVKDRDGGFLLCNEHVLRCLGAQDFEAVRGKSDFDFFPEDQAVEFYAEEQELLDTGRPLVNKERRGKDQTSGAPVWRSTTKLPLKDAEGEIIGLVGIGRDITDIKRAREAYETLVDHSLQGLVVLQDRRVVFANQAMAKISGYSVDEIVAASVEQVGTFVHPEDRKRVWNAHRARMEGEDVPESYAFRAVRKDGTVCWLEIYASRIEYHGQPAIQAACMDVTERICAENALRQSEAQNSALLDAVPDLIFRLSADGTFLDYRTAEGQDFHGLSEDILGKTATEVLPAEVAEELVYFLKQAAETGRTQTFECHLPRDGSAYDLEYRLAPCGDEQVLAMVCDITERKRGERLARIAHELAVKLSAATELRKGVRQGVEAAIEASTMDCGAVYLMDEKAGEMNFVAHAGTESAFVRNVLCVGRTSATMRLVSQGKPVYFDPQERRVPLGPAQKQEGLCTYALLPVLDSQTLVGCLVVGSHRLDAVPRWSRPALEMIATQIGNTVARLRAEEALRCEHALVSRITDTSPAGIMLVNRQGRIVLANACAERILGVAKEQIVERHYNAPEWRITDYDGNPLADEELPFATVLDTREPVYDIRHAIARPDGTRVLLRVNAAPLFDESGQIDGMVTAIDDVTDKVLAEQSLRESEERFRQMFENAVSGIYRTAPDGRILMANPAMVRMLGYPSLEALTKLNVEVTGYVEGYSRSAFKERIEADGQVAGIESAWARYDGTTLFVRENARAVRDECGHTLYYEGTVEDITERRRAEMRLRYRLDFEELVATVSNDFVNLDTDEIEGEITPTLERIGRFAEVDGSFVYLIDGLGTQAGPIYDWYAEGIESHRPDMQDIEIKHFSGTAEKLSRGGILNIPSVSGLQGQDAEVRAVLEASGVRSLLGAPITIGGQLFGFLGLNVVQGERSWSHDEISLVKMVAEIFANALERKRSADALSGRLAFETLLSDLSATFVNLPVDEIDGRIERWLGRLGEFLQIDRTTIGQASHDWSGVELTHFWAAPGLDDVRPDLRYEPLRWVWERLRQGQTVVYRRVEDAPPEAADAVEYCRRQGIKSIAIIPLVAANESLGLLAFSSLHRQRDWSDELLQRLRLVGETFAGALRRKRTEAALVASERNYREIFDATNEGTFIHDPATGAILDANALGEMASGLAHELNQPLGAILNYANNCLRLMRKRELPKATLRESVKELIQQAERAGDIVKRIRGLVGKREPRCVKLDVKALLSDAMSTIEKEAAKYDVTVVPEFKSRLPKVHADDVEIEQVALNLMRNALEAMGDEKVAERTLTVATSRPEKGIVEVAIKDTGRGLSPELSERVFNSFFTTKEHGLGIGLSLSRRIVEAHGGRLWAESDGSSGTTFRFTLPVVGASNKKR